MLSLLLARWLSSGHRQVVGSVLDWVMPKTLKVASIGSLFDAVFRVKLGGLDHPMIRGRVTAAAHRDQNQINQHHC